MRRITDRWRKKSSPTTLFYIQLLNMLEIFTGALMTIWHVNKRYQRKKTVIENNIVPKKTLFVVPVSPPSKKYCTAIITFPEGWRSTWTHRSLHTECLRYSPAGTEGRLQCLTQNSARPLAFLQRSARTDTPTVTSARGSSAVFISSTSSTRPS